MNKAEKKQVAELLDRVVMLGVQAERMDHDAPLWIRKMDQDDLDEVKARLQNDIKGLIDIYVPLAI